MASDMRKAASRLANPFAFSDYLLDCGARSTDPTLILRLAVGGSHTCELESRPPIYLGRLIQMAGMRVKILMLRLRKMDKVFGDIVRISQSRSISQSQTSPSGSAVSASRLLECLSLTLMLIDVQMHEVEHKSAALVILIAMIAYQSARSCRLDPQRSELQGTGKAHAEPWMPLIKISTESYGSKLLCRLSSHAT